jgi:hypothetical protein
LLDYLSTKVAVDSNAGALLTLSKPLGRRFPMSKEEELITTAQPMLPAPPPMQLTLQIIADCRLVIQQEIKRMKTKALQDLPLSNSEGVHLHGLMKTLTLAEDLERKQHVEQLTDGQLSELLAEVMRYEVNPEQNALLTPSKAQQVSNALITANRTKKMEKQAEKRMKAKQKRSKRGRG